MSSMIIQLNGQPFEIAENATVAQLVELRQIPVKGTAIAVNNRLVKRDTWEKTPLHAMDQVTVISAAYGG